MNAKTASSPCRFFRRLYAGLAFVVAALGASAAGADFAEGYDAFRAGDYAEAHALLLPLAETGDARAQGLVAAMLREGLGVAPDLDGALAWYRRATQRPDPDRFALYQLGVLYDRGDGVEQDDAVAVDLYRRAALRGVGAAMLNLGVLVLNGRGIDADPSSALGWFLAALDAGHPRAGSYVDQLGLSAGRGPVAVGQWQAVDYTASPEHPSWRVLPDVLPPFLGARLVMAPSRFSFGRGGCARPIFVSAASPEAAVPGHLVGARGAVEATGPAGAVICRQRTVATLAGLADGRIAMSALGGFLLLDPVPSERVAAAQRLLAERGFAPGPADGIYGPRTADATRRFQEQNGLSITGAISDEILAALSAGETF